MYDVVTTSVHWRLTDPVVTVATTVAAAVVVVISRHYDPIPMRLSAVKFTLVFEPTTTSFTINHLHLHLSPLRNGLAF